MLKCLLRYQEIEPDRGMAVRLLCDLQAGGIRCWLDPVSQASRRRRVKNGPVAFPFWLILLLSATSLQNETIVSELRTSLEEDVKRKQFILIPVILDDALLKRKESWTKDVLNKCPSVSLGNWSDPESYRDGLQLLLSTLRGDYFMDLEASELA